MDEPRLEDFSKEEDEEDRVGVGGRVASNSISQRMEWQRATGEICKLRKIVGVPGRSWDGHVRDQADGMEIQSGRLLYGIQHCCPLLSPVTITLEHSEELCADRLGE